MKKHTGIALIALALTLGGCATVDPAELAATRRQVDELNNRIKQMESDQASMKVRIDEVGKSPRLPSGVSAVPTARRGEAAPQGGQQSSGGYETGLAQYRAGDLNGAIGTFEQFLNSGSASGNEAALAQYWLGDAYYLQRNYDMASRYLGAYHKAQPNGERSQAALNKLVESLRALGRTADADTLASQGVSALQ